MLLIYLLQKIKHSRTNEEDVETKLEDFEFDKVSYIQFHKFWLHLERILHTNFLKQSHCILKLNYCHPKYFPFNQKIKLEFFTEKEVQT